MAQKVVGFIKLQIPAGKATPAPPVGPALGQHGVNIMASGVPNKTKVGKITMAQARQIAEQKMPDLNAATIETATSMICGSARSMGIEVVD